MKRFPVRALIPAALLLLVVVQGVALMRQHAVERTAHVVTSIGSAPAFRLLAADGREVTQAELRGRWALVCLGSTQDPEPLRRLAGAMGALGRQAEQVEALFVATNLPPVTPDAAGRFAGSFGQGILGLSGGTDALRATQDAFGLHTAVRSLVPGEAAQVGGSGPVIAVLAPDGTLRDVLSGTSNSETIAARLRTLGLGDRGT